MKRICFRRARSPPVRTIIIERENSKNLLTINLNGFHLRFGPFDACMKIFDSLSSPIAFLGDRLLAKTRREKKRFKDTKKKSRREKIFEIRRCRFLKCIYSKMHDFRSIEADDKIIDGHINDRQSRARIS